MRIATWNINGLRARLDYLKIWLRDRKPDLVGLQELKLTDEQFPHAELEEAGYRAAVHGQKSWNGVAVLTRNDLEVVQKGLPGQEELGSRLLTVRQGDLTFTTLYCPNGKSVEHPDYERKLAWFEDLTDHLGGQDGSGPAIVCGDFNICPTPLDTWSEEKLGGKIFHTDRERRRYARLTDQGYVDLFRSLYPDEKLFSWWDYRGGAFHRNLGLRIDLLLGTPDVVERLEEVVIDRDFRKKKEGLTASDHAPVYADLR